MDCSSPPHSEGEREIEGGWKEKVRERERDKKRNWDIKTEEESNGDRERNKEKERNTIETEGFNKRRSKNRDIGERRTVRE